MFYILHGEDQLASGERVAEFRAKIGDASVRDLNTTFLDGRRVTLSELRHACDAVPFLADKRLVVVEGLLAYLTSRRGKAEGESSGAARQFMAGLLEYLPTLPDSTRLVLLESRTLPATHPVVKLGLQIDKRRVIEFPLPAKKQAPAWVQKRAALHGGTIEPEAALALVTAVGYDPRPSDRDRTPEQGNKLRVLDQEIRKLLAHANWSRPVTSDDVHQLVADAQQGDLFGMVDALAAGDGRRSVVELHRLLDQGKAPLELFGLIVRQFRLMIQLKELAGRGIAANEAAERLALHPFVADKAGKQAGAFSMEQLEAIYRHLLDVDVQIKTGQAEDVAALDVLVASLTR